MKRGNTNAIENLFLLCRYYLIYYEERVLFKFLQSTFLLDLELFDIRDFDDP